MNTPTWYTRYLYPGTAGPDVQVVRKKLGLVPGTYDYDLSRALNTFQAKHGLPRRGAGVDALTAVALGEREGHRDLPSWWVGTPVASTDPLWDRVEDALGYDLSPDDLRRFQGNFRLPQTGVVDESTARVIHEFEA